MVDMSTVIGDDGAASRIVLSMSLASTNCHVYGDHLILRKDKCAHAS